MPRLPRFILTFADQVLVSWQQGKQSQPVAVTRLFPLAFCSGFLQYVLRPPNTHAAYRAVSSVALRFQVLRSSCRPQCKPKRRLELHWISPK